MCLAAFPTADRAQPCEEFPDLALRPPPLRRAPGPEYAEWARSYQGMPSIERMENGRLWAAWTSGGVNEGPANYLVVLTSEDDGRSWSEPRLVIDPPGLVSALVPILWRDPSDHLWLFWNQGHGAWWDGRGGTWAVRATAAGSPAPRWERPRRLADGLVGGKPTVMSSGEWLLPIAVPLGPSQLGEENEYYRLGLTPCVVEVLSHDLGARKGANVYRSGDEGRTWRFRGQAGGAAAVPDSTEAVDLVEPLLVERRDGSLWMLARTPWGIGASISADGGRAWTAVRDSGIRHPSSRFFVRRLVSGHLLLVRHDPPRVDIPPDCDDCGEWNRSHLKAYVSDDEGRTWRGGMLIDERETVSYPDGTQASDGRIYVIYDRNRYSDREVWLAVFSEEDVLAGACVRDECRLRQSVSRPD